MPDTIRCAHCDQEIDAAEPVCPACGHIHAGTLNCARHAERAAAGACVICGDPVCTECDTATGRHHSCPEHGSVAVIEGWAQIYTTSDTVEADLIKDNLHSEGLDAEVLSQKDHSFTVEMGDLSPVRILVPAYEYTDAMRVLNEHMDYRGEVVFACPSCGEAFEPGDATCRACSTPLPTPARGEAG